MRKYNKIFISHQNVNDEKIKELADQLEENGCEVMISNLEQQLPELSDEEITYEQIDECEVLLVLIGKGPNDNICVEKEIEEADRQDKIVVGIYMGGDEKSIPKSLENIGEGLIINDIKKILSVLDGNQCPWEDNRGFPRQPINKVDKRDC